MAATKAVRGVVDQIAVVDRKRVQREARRGEKEASRKIHHHDAGIAARGNALRPGQIDTAWPAEESTVVDRQGRKSIGAECGLRRSPHVVEEGRRQRIGGIVSGKRPERDPGRDGPAAVDGNGPYDRVRVAGPLEPAPGHVNEACLWIHLDGCSLAEAGAGTLPLVDRVQRDRRAPGRAAVAGSGEEQLARSRYASHWVECEF